jgi:DNA-binding CsgD family transcriptional regulator
MGVLPGFGEIVRRSGAAGKRESPFSGAHGINIPKIRISYYGIPKYGISMSETSLSQNSRAAIREAAAARRTAKAERRRALLDLVISGHGYSQIAETMKISVATVRREVDRALARLRPQPPENYVLLQMARVQKALLSVDQRLEKGDLRAVPALATLLGEFDRYQDVATALGLGAPAKPPLQKKAPKRLKSPDRSTKFPSRPAEIAEGRMNEIDSWFP